MITASRIFGFRGTTLLFLSGVGSTIEHMFGQATSGIELLESRDPSGQSSLNAEDQLAYEVTCRELADGWVESDRHVLPPGFEDLPLSFLAVLARSVDRARLNGYDAIRLMQAEARLESSFAASKLATMAEVAHCPPGGAESPVERSTDEIPYAADEIAPALTLTRRAAESQLDQALALRGRLSRVWDRFARGGLSLQKVREFIRTLEHHDQSLIDDVLTFSDIEAGTLTLTCGPVQLAGGEEVGRYGDAARPRCDEIARVPLRPLDKQMNLKRQIRCFPQACHNRQPDGDFLDKVAVHDVHVHHGRPGRLDDLKRLPKPRPVRSYDGRRD